MDYEIALMVEMQVLMYPCRQTQPARQTGYDRSRKSLGSLLEKAYLPVLPALPGQ